MTITIGVLFLWLLSTLYWAIGGNTKLATYCLAVATACMAILLHSAGRGLFLH